MKGEVCVMQVSPLSFYPFTFLLFYFFTFLPLSIKQLFPRDMQIPVVADLVVLQPVGKLLVWAKGRINFLLVRRHGDALLRIAEVTLRNDQRPADMVVVGILVCKAVAKYAFKLILIGVSLPNAGIHSLVVLDIVDDEGVDTVEGDAARHLTRPASDAERPDHWISLGTYPFHLHMGGIILDALNTSHLVTLLTENPMDILKEVDDGLAITTLDECAALCYQGTLKRIARIHGFIFQNFNTH